MEGNSTEPQDFMAILKKKNVMLKNSRIKNLSLFFIVL